MTLLKEQNNAPVPYATIMIVLGIIGILIGLGARNQSVDEGQLTSIKITVQESPKRINGTKNTEAHFRINANEYLSPFWITGTALSIVSENDELQLALQQKKVNDTLQVIFLSARQNRLDSPLDPIEIYGLTDAEREYFSPGIIASRDRQTSNAIFLCSGALLIIGLVLIIRKITRPAPAT
jgi:hypothetical protein